MKIDIRLIVKSKNYKLYNKIPSLIFWIFEKIIHQKDINEILYKYGHLKDVDFIEATLNHLSIEREAIGLDAPIESETSRIIFAANHPLGGVDGFALAEAIKAKYGDVRIVVNDILMNIEPVKNIFVPINKHGKQNSCYAEMLNNMYASNIPILYFPAGLCSRKINGKIEDVKWHNSFAKKAIEYERDIVPVKVNSLNSTFFYIFALLRKRLKIKANLEMILLPSELFKKRGKSIRMIFGKRISFESFKDCTNIKAFVLDVRQQCYSLDK